MVDHQFWLSWCFFLIEIDYAQFTNCVVWGIQTIFWVWVWVKKTGYQLTHRINFGFSMKPSRFKILNWLVVWLPSIWHFPINLGLLIIPTDELIFFRTGWPWPTKQSKVDGLKPQDRPKPTDAMITMDPSGGVLK